MVRLPIKIKQLRVDRGMTQSQLAERAGLDATMICKIETGKAKPSLDSLPNIAAALGVTVTSLLDDDQPVPVRRCAG